MKHLVENSPRRAEMILDKLAGGQLSLRLEPDADAMQSLNRLAGRISRSMVLSSVIIAGGYVLGSLVRRAQAKRR